MAKSASDRKDVYLAPKLTKKALESVKELLVLVGKPFYLLLTSVAIALLFLFYTLGHAIIAGVRFTSRLRLPRVKFRIRLNVKIVLGIFGFVLLSFLLWLSVLRGLPSPKELTSRQIEVSTKIYDRSGVLLYKIYKNQNRTPVSLSQIPPAVRLATLAAEDAEFYNHIGFSVRGITRAFWKNIRKGELSGGSTITQQLVKNSLLTPEKTLSRKIKELILSIEVELTFSKDQILEMYLNQVAYGGTAYGIQEASRSFFGKDVDKLSLAEAALLAGLPKSPTKNSPFGANPSAAIDRQKEVLNLMVINHFVGKEEAQKAEQERLVFAPNKIDIKAPHFVMYVRQILAEKYGEEVLEKGGLEVITSLDWEIQKKAEEAVSAGVKGLSGLRVGNGAALVMVPASGEILAMVGSKDYFDTAAQGNVNVTTALRQPGSSIKIVNYAYALSHGYTLASILDDSPVTFNVAGLPPYSPKNYDGTFRGRLPLRNALAESRNIPAVKVLASYGVGKMLEMGKSLGITSWKDPSNYGLSLTLGGGEVKLIELARAYATLANYGKRPEITPILKVTNYQGKVLEENRCKKGLVVMAAEAGSSCDQTQVLDPRVAFLLIDTLKDTSARIPAFGTHSSLVISGHPEVGVKTGTSNDLRDNLTLGFNQEYLVATWVGNNDGSPMGRLASGITGAAPIWNQIMTGLLEKKPSQEWEVPKGLVSLAVCSSSGSLACEGCRSRVEWFLQENKLNQACERPEPPREGKIIEPAAKTQFP